MTIRIIIPSHHVKAIAAIAPRRPRVHTGCTIKAPLLFPPLLPVDVLEPSALPVAESTLILVGRAAAAEVGCVSIAPLPTMTGTPVLGMPLMVTKKSAGPGWKRFAFGGAWAT